MSDPLSNAPADAVNGNNENVDKADDAENEAARGPSPALLEALAPLLVWRIGRATDEGPVTVRVGLASSAGLFAELPRLKTVGDAELEAAAREGELRVEWVGHALEGAGGV